MPNARRSGATQRKKKAAAARAAMSPENPTSGTQFSFSFNPSTFNPSGSSSNPTTPNGTKKSGFAPPPDSSSSEDVGHGDDTSEEEEESSDDNSDSSHDSDVIIVEPEIASQPKEKPAADLSPAEKKERAEQRKATGNEFYKKKDYPNATRFYTQAIELDPSNAAYFTNRAASRMEAKLFKLALDDLLAASALQSKDPQPKTLLRLGKCQLALGMFVQAQQTLDQAFSLDGGKTPAIQSERAKAARIANHVSNIKREVNEKNWSMVLFAVNAAANEVEVTPKEWLIWKLEALMGKKEYEKGLNLATDLLRSDQNQPDVLYYRGLILYYSGNHAQAITHCQQALRNDPDYTKARQLLKKIRAIDLLKESGNEAFKSGKLAEAIKFYSEGLETVETANESLRATLLSNRATAHLKLKQFDLALADCSACIEIDPKYFKAFRTRGRINLATEDFEAAVADLKQAYEFAPAGSSDESALQREVKEAEQALKKSKMKDHYKTLGITSEAGEVEIKKAYRKMSLIHHPDKGGTEAKFKDIGEAYAILSDPQRRRKFDMGIDENDPHAGHEDMGGFGGSPFGGGGVNMEDLFGGGGGFHSFGGGGGRRQHPGFSYGF